MSGGFEVNGADRARWLVTAQLREVASLLGLGTGPLDGVRTALFVRDVAAGQVRTYAEQARGRSASWAAVDTALGLAELADRAAVPLAEAAWSYVVAGVAPGQVPDDPWRQRAARWTCGSCGQRVTDRSPFDADPGECEQGHAADCPRHRAELAAFERDLRGGGNDA